MDDRLEDSLQFLKDFKKGDQKMKLGTVQRWVRDINLNTLEPEKQKVRALDMVLRCTEEFKDFDLVEDDAGKGLIFMKEEWAPVEKKEADEELLDQFDENSYKVIKFEKANER